VEHLLFTGDLCHRDRDAGVHVANDEAHLIAFDQLPCFLHAGADIICRIFNQEFDRPAQYAALLVDLLGSEFCSHHLALRDRGIDSGYRIDHSDPYRRFASRLDDEGGSELHRSKCGACLQDSPPIDRP
jgi:hypothetical protein